MELACLANKDGNIQTTVKSIWAMFCTVFQLLSDSPVLFAISSRAARNQKLDHNTMARLLNQG
jgi:hypothetical protein